MLWHKAWLETRGRFLTGLAVLTIVAAGTIFDYRAVVSLMPAAHAIDTSSPLGRMIGEAVDVQRDFHGFIWWQWFRQNLLELGTLFAILLGAGGLVSGGTGGSALFTLSLPVSRSRLLAVRAATGLSELFVLACAPSLVIPLLSPAIGQSYAVADVLVHGACLFVGGAVFYSLTLLLSATVAGVWQPLLAAGFVAAALGVFEQFISGLSPYGIFGAMSGASYFRSGTLPWPGLAVSAAASAALLYGAASSFARHDY